MLDLRGLGQEDEPVRFAPQIRGYVMRQRLAARFFVGRIKNEAILQFTRNHHFGDRVREPLFDFLDHVVHIGVDKAVEFVWPEAEPRHRLQKQ